MDIVKLKESISQHIAEYDDAFSGCERNHIPIHRERVAVRDMLAAILVLLERTEKHDPR